MEKMMRLTMVVAIVVCGLSMLTSCSSDNDENPIQPGYDGVPLVILDTDIGSSTDDLIAMEMLYNYMDEGRCKLLGVVVDRMGDDYAALADVMNTYFGHGSIPIGVERGGIKDPSVFIDYRELYKHTTEKGELMFKRTISDYSQLPNGWELYRRLLAAQPDHSVSICSTGLVSSLVQPVYSHPLRNRTIISCRIRRMQSCSLSFGLVALMSYTRRWKWAMKSITAQRMSSEISVGRTFTPSSRST